MDWWPVFGQSGGMSGDLVMGKKERLRAATALIETRLNEV